MDSAPRGAPADRRPSFPLVIALLAITSTILVLAKPYFVDPDPPASSGDPGEGGVVMAKDPSLVTPPGAITAQGTPAAGYVRAFEVRYGVDKATEFQDLPSGADRDQVRAALSANIDNKVTYKTQFHVFPTRPSVADLVAYIDENILGPDLAVKAATAQQEHVWRQGSWVCETRFAIVDKTSQDDLDASTTVQGTTFQATGYWIAAYDFHSSE